MDRCFSNFTMHKDTEDLVRIADSKSVWWVGPELLHFSGVGADPQTTCWEANIWVTAPGPSKPVVWSTRRTTTRNKENQAKAQSQSSPDSVTCALWEEREWCAYLCIWMFFLTFSLLKYQFRFSFLILSYSSLVKSSTLLYPSHILLSTDFNIYMYPRRQIQWNKNVF